MKNVLAVLLLIVASFTLISCDITRIEDAVDNFAIVIGLEPINTSATVLVTDAATGELVNANIQTVFTGTNGSDVIDMYSDPLESVTIEGGILNFGIRNDIEADENSPATITLEMSAPGYLPSSRTIEISQAGANSYSVSLIRANNAPAGVEVQSSSVGTTNQYGALNEDVNVEIRNTSIVTNQETGASVSVSSGSVFLGDDGAPLTGTLQSEAIYYNADEPEAVNAMPVELLSNEGDSVLTMLGAIDLSIKDSNGREAVSVQGAGNSVGKAVSNTDEYILNFIINSSTYSELQQILRLAYISPTTAERLILYTVPEITTLENGRVELRYVLNSGLFKSAALVYFSEQPCNTSLRVNRNGNEGTISYRITDRGFYRSGDLQAGQNTIQLRNMTRGPKNISFNLPISTHSESIDFCSVSDASIDLPAPPIEIIDSEINVELSCSNPSEKVRVTDIPVASVLYRESNSGSGTPWRVASDLSWDYNQDTQALTGGSFMAAGVKLNSDYTFRVVYDSNSESTSIPITGAQITYSEIVDSDICN